MQDRNSIFSSILPDELRKCIYQSSVLSSLHLISLEKTATFFYNDVALKQQIFKKMQDEFKIKQLVHYINAKDLLYVLNCGLIAAYGNNASGKLGLDCVNSVQSPTIIPTFKQVPIMKAAMGCKHSLFLDKNNKLWACGNNEKGQLGLGKHINSLRVPTLIELTFPVKDIQCGLDYSVIKDEKDTLYFCGSNYMNLSELGDEPIIHEFRELPPSSLLSLQFSSKAAINNNGGQFLSSLIPQKYQVHPLQEEIPSATVRF